MDTLHLLSGGIDSTYTMWKWLQEHPDKKLLVHHVVLKTNHYRWEKEKEAVDKILAWFKAQNLKNFRYTESVFDVCQIDPKVWDSTINGFIAGLILTEYKEIKYLLNNTPKDEVERLGDHLAIMTEKSAKTRTIVAERPVQVQKVLIDKYKATIMAEMPPDLLMLCWYCRKPTEDGETCGKCHTCQQVRRAYENSLET